MGADIRGVAQDVRGAVLLDTGNRLDALFMRGLHREQPFLGVPRDIIDIDKLVMHVAEQHQIVDGVRQKRRADRVAAGAVRNVGDDMRHEAESLVLGPEIRSPIRSLLQPAYWHRPPAFAHTIIRVSVNQHWSGTPT